MAPAASGVRILEICDSCGHVTYSDVSDPTKLIDPAQWDGSDLFMVWPLPRFIFVSPRCAGLLRKSELTGFDLIPVARDPVDPGGTLTPGSLERWMPEELARARKSSLRRRS